MTDCRYTSHASTVCCHGYFCQILGSQITHIWPASEATIAATGLLQALSDISKSKKLVPTSIEFVDIAGLVKGASTGEGLGNKFLANIRECDSIFQAMTAPHC